MNPKTWKYDIRKQYGVELLNDKVPQYALWVTHCSKTKSGKTKALPKEFYVSKRNLLFYSVMEKNQFSYGILSDKYGIHLHDEELKYYNIHPSKLSLLDKMKLGITIGEKCQSRNFRSIIYWSPSPLFARPYLEMLKYSGLKVYFTTVLNVSKREALYSNEIRKSIHE
jgi:hypothetical protein